MGNLQSLSDNGVPDGLQYFDEENIANIGHSSFNRQHASSSRQGALSIGRDGDGDVVMEGL